MKFLSKSKYLLLILLSACQVSSSDKDVAEKLFELIGGSGEFALVTEELADKNQSQVNYIEVVINDSKLLQSESMNKELIASFSADFLYSNLESKSIQENNGINVAYGDDDISTKLKKPFYYSMSDLSAINEHYRTINQFMKSYKLAPLPTDYLNDNISAADSIKNEKANRQIDSFEYYNAELLSYFHQKINKSNKLIIIGLYELENKKQVAIQYIVDKKPIDNPIYSIIIMD